MKIVKEHINEEFEEKSDPIRDLGIGMIYHIDFFYSDHPSIDDSEVAFFIENLESAIQDINPSVEYEIRITDFANGVINFKGGELRAEEMLEKLKEVREASFASFENNLASWDFGDVTKGVFKGGKIYDPVEYETEYCENCGEEITSYNELTGDGYCESCAEEDEDDEK
jgi:hypothetical protein